MQAAGRQLLGMVDARHRIAGRNGRGIVDFGQAFDLFDVKNRVALHVGNLVLNILPGLLATLGMLIKGQDLANIVFGNTFLRMGTRTRNSTTCCPISFRCRVEEGRERSPEGTRQIRASTVASAQASHAHPMVRYSFFCIFFSKMRPAAEGGRFRRLERPRGKGTKMPR